METKNVRYFVQDQGCVTDGPFEELADAVFWAAVHDGWGARYMRDESGEMRLYSSRWHIGNNVYIPKDDEGSIDSSSNPDDAEAISEVAQDIFNRGCSLHNKYDMSIVTVTYDDAGQVKTINGETLSDRNSDMDDPAAASADDQNTYKL
jgi:hypothetical protein